MNLETPYSIGDTIWILTTSLAPKGNARHGAKELHQVCIDFIKIKVARVGYFEDSDRPIHSSLYIEYGWNLGRDFRKVKEVWTSPEDFFSVAQKELYELRKHPKSAKKLIEEKIQLIVEVQWYIENRERLINTP